MVDSAGDKDTITIKVLDNHSTFQEILDGIKEYQVVMNENKLLGDTDCNRDSNF